MYCLDNFLRLHYLRRLRHIFVICHDVWNLLDPEYLWNLKSDIRFDIQHFADIRHLKHCIEYILSFTGSIYDMLRFTDINKPSLHSVYDMWDTMIEKVKSVTYRHEGKRDDEEFFFCVVHKIFVDRWNKYQYITSLLGSSIEPDVQSRMKH